MTRLTVDALTAEHHGQTARVTLTAGDTRQGVITRQRNPSYPRRDVTHWWLLIPSALPHFERDALSLQWSGHALVELLPQEGNTP